MRAFLVTLAVIPLCSATCRSRPAEPTTAPAPERALSARPATHAGSWYPGSKAELQKDIQTRLGKHEAAGGDPVIAVVGPHAGIRWSGDVAAAAYKQLAGQHVERAFLLGPSHHVGFDGIALPSADMGAYATPLGDLPIDQEAVASLRGKPGFDGPARAHLPEHSLEMHAIFLAAVHPGVKLVPLVVGRVGSGGTTERLASAIRPLLGPGDVVLVSSDFTHYGARFGYTPVSGAVVPDHLTSLMDRAREPILARNLDGFAHHLRKTNDSICGRAPIEVLLALLPDDAQGSEIARDTSGHMTGDFSSSVSYLSLVFRRAGGWQSGEHGFQQGRQVLDQQQRQLALSMVRKTLSAYLERNVTPDDKELGVPESGPFRETFSVFVTLEKHGALRGCIGHILPVQELWKDIRENAISAAVRDHRFPPVTRTELDQLHVEISVLTPPEPIAGPEGFEVGRHGIIVQAHGRRAVYLPQVAPEQGWDRATTLTHLSRKAGLPGDAWKSEDARLKVFEAQVFAEPE